MGDFDAAGGTLQLAESSSHAWGSLKASFRKGRFPTQVGNWGFFPLPFQRVRRIITQVGPPHGVAGTGGFGLSSLHACGKPYYSLSSRVLRTLFPTPVWETGCRGKTGGRKERRNIAFPTRVGETSFGSQYAHSYDFFPTRMGKPHAHDPSLTCHVVFPTCYGGVPSSPGDARTGSWSSLHYGGVPPAVPFPMLLTPPFGRPEASPHVPRARQCCVPVWTPFMREGLSRPVFCFVPCKRQRCAIVLAPPDAVLQRSTHD